ncbi:MAG: cytochrome c biogenesis protein [Flavobacterium sp.]|nr:cytochrome c biogenesis protein [Flavobacterium sp.]
MKLLKLQKSLKILTDLRFAIFLLALIALFSSLGTFIEQDEPLFFYQKNYATENPIYGFVDWKFITFFGLEHVYTTWWFFLLLFLLAASLIGCTITRQFPIFFNAKDYLFKKQKNSFLNLNFFVRLKPVPYLKELILVKIQNMNFYTYQKANVIYGYKGLIGRISPILVHFSLIVILSGSFVGAFKNFKAQEILPKGEIFHIQNTLKVGFLTDLPLFNVRVNDFWAEYKNNRIHQFYSNLSVLDNLGNELKQQTISVNNPLRYHGVDFYQSDWNLLGIRIENLTTKKIYELPLFPLKKDTKSWISWVVSQFENQQSVPLTLIFDQFQNIFFVYDTKGTFLGSKNVGDLISKDLQILEILPSTGLLVKYDPSISIIYFGFGILMITTFLSYLPYTQFWIFQKEKEFWVGSSTNRGKIQFELQFENLLRESETNMQPFRLLAKEIDGK